MRGIAPVATTGVPGTMRAMKHAEFDFVIVGAGSAGCVLAERLSASGRHQVAVVEAGGSDRRLWVQLPMGYGKTYDDPAINWCYHTAPLAALHNRRSFWPRGKLLGGSGSINAMVYIRGNDADFDDWARAGNPGWAAADVRRCFEALETRDRQHRVPPRLHVSDVSDQIHELCDAFFASANALNLPLSRDFNLDRFDGLGCYSITTRDGLRMSPARAFLHPALRRSNLHLFKHTQAQRLQFDAGRVTGIECVQGEVPLLLKARAEVILSAGAIGSPLLLQRSGVGPAELLQRHGIAVRHHNPAVGAALQDHIAVSYLYRCKRATLNNELGPWHGKARAALRYLLTRRGPLSLSINQAGGFVRSAAALAEPDLQLYFTPATYNKTLPEGARARIDFDPWPGFLTSFQPCRPLSRGTIQIASAEPADAPIIEPGYLTHQADIDTVVRGCRLLRWLAASPPLQAIIECETLPGEQLDSDDELLEDFRQRADTVYHPVGSCAMSDDASRAVVDSRLRAHGIGGLRVVDASVFPNLTSGNTNAASMMVGQKGAEMILQDTTS